MIGLDTNVVVRYLAQDDPKQSAAASRFFERVLTPENRGFVPVVVLCELAWVLAECYGARRVRIRQAIEGLLAAKQLAVETPDVVRKALRAWDESAADFADALIGELARASGADKTVTFDRAAAKLPGFELLQ
ncbi:MAG: type II toxin-antitoxin system VapC family toxin [Betaproteobacteria bacterium]|nr:type II toxin-antitoxin system VapC family toxin [Betaproteobacteria bacterium]